MAAVLRALVPSWRAAMPALGVIVVAAVAWTLLARRPTVSAQRSGAPPAPLAVLKSLPLPTLANYMAAANRSLDDFDALVTRQGNRKLTRLAVYNASAFEGMADSR
jgi:hypothetical protein